MRVLLLRRRALIVAAGAAALLPGVAHSGEFACGGALRIAVLAPLTGPLAGQPRDYIDGVVEAADAARRQGCAVSVITLDAGTAMQQVISSARAAGADRASVIIGAYGTAIARQAAVRATDALVVDLMGGSPLQPRPVNLVAVPYGDLFFTVDPVRRSASLRMAGLTAATVVLETIRSAAPGSIRTPSALVDAMTVRRYETPAGLLALDRSSGAFRRV